MTGPAPKSWYEEAFTDSGVLRPAYAALRRRTGWEPLCPPAAAAARLRDRPLGDDVRIFPVPLVIDGQEYRSVVRAGLAQRGQALQRLFADLVFGTQRVLGAGIGLTGELLDQILAVEGTSLTRLRRLWRGRDREAIRFVYGPDLVRNPDGRWVVLEDNVGCVGGSADGFFVANRFRAVTGLPACPGCDRRPDLMIAVQRWLRRVAAADDIDIGDDIDGAAVRDRPDGVLAVLGCDVGAGADPWALQLRENARRRRILDTLGIPVVNGGQFEREWFSGRSRKSKTLINFDVGTQEGSALCQAFADPGVAMLNSPGTGVLGNKAWLPYIDDVIRFFLRQEPILPTPPTHLLGNGVLPADKDRWVVKSAAGRQGTEVFVLGGQPRQRLEYLEGLLRRHWAGAGAVAQQYVEPSCLSPAGPGGWDGYRVEIRPVSYVYGWQAMYVGGQPVGKVVSSYDSRRLNNISQGACYAPVLREPCCAGDARGAPMSREESLTGTGQRA